MASNGAPSATHRTRPQNGGEEEVRAGTKRYWWRPGRPKTNIFHAVMDRQVGHRSMQGLRHLPEKVVARHNREHEGLPEIVLALEDAHVRGDLSTVRSMLKKASELLTDRSYNWDGQSNNLRESFILFGGAQCLVRALQIPIEAEGIRNSGWRGQVANDRNAWEVRKECLQVLRDLCYSTPTLSEQLCSQRAFIVFLFSLMRNQTTFDEAVGLTEEVLAFRGEIFNLSLVPDFEGLVNSFSKRQMAFFCRVLALVVFEVEERPSEDLKITKAADLLTARREQALSPAVKNTDRNHAVLLGIENLLPRMIKLVLVHAMPMSRWADEIMAHLPSAHHQDLLNLLGVEDGDDWDEEPSAGAATNDPQESIKALALLTHQVEVLFVMCTLLAGKRKAQVQDTLLELNIVQALIQMFDRLEWNRPPSSSPPFERIHGPGCECNPESALRIQYLRLVHNLSDREYDHKHTKHKLLSQAEIDSVEKYAVYDSLKQFMFLGGGVAEDDGVLRCPPEVGDSDIEVQQWDAMWGEAVRGCEHYQFSGEGDDPDSDEFWSPNKEVGPAPGTNGGPQLPASVANICASWDMAGLDGVTGSLAVASGAGLQHALPSINGPPPACLNTRRMQPRSRSRSHAAAGEDGKQEKGLVSRILQVFMKETPDSTYRFWLASCVEAFLRGSDVRSQVLMAQAGLLSHLVDGVLNSQCSGNLQTNFDLLGELIKCNPEVFAMFNDILNEKKYTAFMQVVVSNLVDSNVFIRSVILSLEFFSARQRELMALGSRYDMSICKMRRFLQHNTLRLLRDLMTVITVEEVNQENICCLNTALSLFILARSHGQLPHYLDALRRWEVANQKIGQVTGNFLSLLKFWHEYYLYRGKDCLSLELSSNIHFSEWRRIVHTLTEMLEEMKECSQTDLIAYGVGSMAIRAEG